MGTGRRFSFSFRDIQAIFAPSNKFYSISILSLSMLMTSFLNNLFVQHLRDDNTLQNFVQQLIIYSHLGAIYVKSSCNDVHFWFPFQTSIELSKFITGSEVKERKRKYVVLRFNDGKFIYLVIFPLASKSRINFRNLKLPVQGKSRVFKSQQSSHQGTKEYVRW